MISNDMIFIGIITCVIFILFAGGIVVFILKYRKSKIEYNTDKQSLVLGHQQELLQNQQQTMQFIGREIHDNVGQKLTLASLYIKQQTGSDVTQPDRLKMIGDIIDESLADLRQLSRSLSDPSLANASLKEMLLQEAVRINKLGSCHVSVTDRSGNTSLQHAQKNILFRILQEFIQNSLKYSGCRKIFIEIMQSENDVEVIAADDGKGFDSNIPYNGQGIGNMRRRAEELNGVYTLFSKPGSGTRLNIKIPYTNNHEI